MKKPEPQIGLVVRYDFLWSHEQAKGYAQGAKERPCVIVTAIVRKTTGETTVLVAPITHSTPGEGDAVIEIPAAVGRHLGLDEARSYIVAGEANSVSWDDPGIVPALPGVRWALRADSQDVIRPAARRHDRSGGQAEDEGRRSQTLSLRARRRNADQALGVHDQRALVTT